MNDNTLDGASAEAVFTLEPIGTFSRFRLRLTGPSSDESLRIALARWELQGSYHFDETSQIPDPTATHRRELPRVAADDGETGQGLGLLEFLATKGSLQAAQNPARAGLLHVLTSGPGEPVTHPADMLPPESVLIESPPSPGAWIMVELPADHSFATTAYRLGLDPHTGRIPVESWVLEGSNNGVNWQLLHNGFEAKPDEENDGRLTWALTVDPGWPPFRLLRLRATGLGAIEPMSFRVTGLEIFGVAYGPKFADTLLLTPSCKPLVFEPGEDFDGSGIVAYFATSGGLHSYKNPALRGLIAASSSSLGADSQPPHAILGNAAVRSLTMPESNAWYQVDFRNNTVAPTHYSLRHYSTWDTEALRNWKLQASNNGLTWTTLREHVDDTALSGAGDTHTWEIDHPSAALGYRMFRVLQTGLNSNNHNYLALSGFELHGTLCIKQSPAPLPADGRTFNHVSDFDGNGLVHYLATDDGTTAYRNPAEAGRMRVAASSILDNSEPAHAAVGRDAVRCATKPVPGSWFEFDFMDIAIAPTHYTLRHYSSWDTEALRSWQLLGSNDGSQWALLDEKTSDTTLDKRGASGTFTITYPQGIHFRLLRLVQTGVNSNAHHYLALSGFEVYGHAESTQFEPVAESLEEFDFEFLSGFDGQGLVHHLATLGGSEPYWNPTLRGLANTTSSPLMNDSVPAHAILGQETVRCVTRPQTGAFFAVEFPGLRVCPSWVSLRHYSSWDTEALRNWQLQGSNDGIQWRTLSTHTNDPSLQARGDEASWRVDGTEAWSHFRILQTGPNSNGHRYLALSGFELHGRVFANTVVHPNFLQPGTPRGLLGLTNAGAFNGILHYLGTANGTRPFINPSLISLVLASSSSLGSSSQSASAITGNQAVRCLTQAVSNSWMQVDFRNLRVRPTGYALRHYSSWDTEALRNWQLQASNDGTTWDTLSTHVNDTALNSAGAEHFWPLPKLIGAYRYFRILQTGTNSNNHHYLALSGIELHGELLDEQLSPNAVYNRWAYEQGLAHGPQQGTQADPNLDGETNFSHFVFATPPGHSPGQAKPLSLELISEPPVGGSTSHFAITLPVRGEAPLMNNRITGDGVNYHLQTFLIPGEPVILPMQEVIPANTAGLPGLPPGYQYRTFRLTDSVKKLPRAFFQLEGSSPTP